VLPFRRGVKGDQDRGVHQSLADAERADILAVLKDTQRVLSGPRGAATRLGMNRSTPQFRMRKLGVAHSVAAG
jgi:formate hydrogenlyase transcriptional activator